MSKEPCMTLTDLSREKRDNGSQLYTYWKKKTPLPKEVIFPGKLSNSSGKKYYKRSELLAWYDRAKPDANR